MATEDLRNFLTWLLALCLLLAGCSLKDSPAPSGAPPASSGGGQPTQSGSPAAKPATPTPARPAATPGGGPPVPALKTPLPGSLAFELIQTGAALDGAAPALFIAMRGEQAGQSAPAGLPAQARQTLEAALANGEAALILALYAGEKPSGGFSVQIKNLILQQESGREILLVQYYILPPDPQLGATAVLTYPYLIVKLASALLPSQVRFEAVAP